jgi:ABC-type transporter Mla MlaB component
MLDRVPPKTEFQLHVDKLLYIDHSCLDFLATWMKQQKQKESTVTMQWEKSENSFHQLLVQ